MQRLHLVDVSNMFFRAFFALPPLRSKAGMPTNALYGFLSMTVKLLREQKATHLAYCFDSKAPSFRSQLDTNYKATRSEAPEDLVPQIPYVRQLTDLLGIPAFEKPGFEADDIIGTLCEMGVRDGFEVVIVSGDKDFSQLVREPGVCIYDAMKNLTIRHDDVVKRWGVRPEQFVDYLAIVGDSSDNIPGVRGVGPKGASTLLEKFGSLQNIYDHLEDIPNPGLKEKMRLSKEAAFLSRQLADLHKTVELPVEKTEQLIKQPVRLAELRELFQKLDFQNFEKTLIPADAPPAAVAAEASIPSATAPANATEVAPLEAPRVPAALDSLKVNAAEPLFVSRAGQIKTNEPIWLISHLSGTYLYQAPHFFFLQGEGWQSYFSRHVLSWKGFDLKAEWKKWNIPQGRCVWDHMVAHHVLTSQGEDDFFDLLEKVLGRKLDPTTSPEELLLGHLELEEKIKSDIHRDGMDKVLNEIELPLVDVLHQMEAHGILVDPQILKEQSKLASADLLRIESEVRTDVGEVGTEFNLGSPKQLSHVLFEKLKMPVIKKTKTGFSTDSEVLEKLGETYPVCLKILDYRELSKLKSTYLDSLPQLINEKTGRIHSHFNQVGAATGRISSDNPNLQNIPIRTERGNLVRRAFVAKKGSVLIAADYSQIELRILAHITGDPGLCGAFEKDLDIHAATASEIFNVAVDQVSSDQRRMAKAVNFGLAYGQGVFGLAETLKIPRADSKKIIDEYFTKFPGVREYMVQSVEAAQKTGYAVTLFGRRRYVPEIQSKNKAIEKFGERIAINAPIQGSAADLVKKVMVDLGDELKQEMLLQVHDELVFESPEELLPERIKLIQDRMENVLKLRVPLRVNIAHGPSWFEA